MTRADTDATSSLRLGLASLSACYAAILINIILHEYLGHALALSFGEGRLLSVTISPALSGLTRSEGTPEGWARIALNAGGISVNLILCLLTLIFAWPRRRLSSPAFAMTWFVLGAALSAAATAFQGLLLGRGDAAALRSLGAASRFALGGTFALAIFAVLVWSARRLGGFLEDQIGRREQGTRVLGASLAFGLPFAPLAALVLAPPNPSGAWSLRLVLGAMTLFAGAALGLRAPPPRDDEEGKPFSWRPVGIWIVLAIALGAGAGLGLFDWAPR